MIPLLIFYLHIIALAAGFTRRWQDEGVPEGLLAVFFIALIFFVGWSMASFIMKIVMPAEGWGLDRDAASLLLLTVAEGIFYYFYLKTDAPDGSPPPSGTLP
jgi:hypothetical protein